MCVLRTSVATPPLWESSEYPSDREGPFVKWDKGEPVSSPFLALWDWTLLVHLGSFSHDNQKDWATGHDNHSLP